MEISWKKQKLKQTVLEYAKSNEITARLMISIVAASNFLDLVPNSKGRAHFLKGNLRGHFSIDLESKGNGKRLICIPTGNYQIKDGQYIKQSISEFEIIAIENTHKN